MVLSIGLALPLFLIELVAFVVSGRARLLEVLGFVLRTPLTLTGFVKLLAGLRRNARLLLGRGVRTLLFVLIIILIIMLSSADQRRQSHTRC